MASPRPAPLRRPNGRLQACDPCRKRKVACDHTQPVCNRCRARKQAQRCVYIVGDAPGTTPPRTASLFDEVQSLSRSSAEVWSPNPGASLPVTVDETSAVDFNLHTPTSHQDGANTGATPSTEPQTGHGTGFLGMTSHSSVFDETRNTLSLLQGFQAWMPESKAKTANRGLADASDILLSPTREMCLTVLRSLPLTEGSIHFQSNLAGWAKAVAEDVFQSLCKRFSKQRSGCRSDAELLELAALLSRNSAKPFDQDLEDPKEWMAQLSGDQLRWESIGMIFTCNFEEDWDALYGQKDPDRAQAKSWPEVSRICLGLCIDLTRRFSDGNPILLHLCVRRVVIESVLVGDASFSCWRSLAEAVAVATFLGYHTEQYDANYRPTIGSEVRRRIFIHLFVLDKICVLFSGRPPHISRRYVSTPVPLDISDDEVIRGKDSLAAAASLLDEDGWGRDGYRYICALRARFKMAFIRDELVEIALGSGRQLQPSLDTLLQIKQRQNATWASFPTSLTYQNWEIDDSSTNVSQLATRMLLKLEHLQNMFLIERLLRRGGFPDQGELLATSFEMVSITQLFWKNKDRFSHIRSDFGWIVMQYATPGGGILCMELLNPSFSGHHPLNAKITRSNIIQQLSLLIGFLDWVGRRGTNGDLCVSCSTVIEGVLNYVLNPRDNESWPPSNMDDMQLDFNFELLDTYDWLRPDAQLS